MLDTWKNWFVTLNTYDQPNEIWEAVANVVATENETAIIWRSLLTAGSVSPSFYAQRFWTILLDPILLSSIPETARDCINVFAPQLSNDAISKIELAILKIDNTQSKDVNVTSNDKHLRLKITLLQAIPEENRGTAAKEFLSKCDLELLQFSEHHPRTTQGIQHVTPEMWLTEQDIDKTKPRNHELLETSDFLEKLLSNNIIDSNLVDILGKIRKIKQTMAKSHEEIEDRVTSIIEDRLTRGYAQITCSQVALNVQLSNELFEHFKTIMLKDSQTASSQSLVLTQSFGWDAFDHKINAAQGLVCLATKINELTDDHKSLLRRIAKDPEKNVRFQLSQRICLIFDKCPEFTWEILELWVAELPNQPEHHEVLEVALSSNLFWRLWKNNSTQTNQFLRNLVTAAQTSSSKELRRICGSWLAALSFLKDETWTLEILNSKMGNIKENLEEIDGALHVATAKLLPRTQKLCRTRQHKQAIRFLLDLLGVASRSLEAYRIEVNNLSISDKPVQQPLWVSQLYQFFNYVTIEFRFSADEHAKQWITGENNEIKEQMAIWRETTEPILDSILTIPYPQIAYNLIEGLEHIIWFDIERGLYWLRRVTTASAPFGLASESLAADHTIKILGRILAEHKGALKVSNPRSDFIQILDEYLQIGWPSAVSLAIQIESFFR